MCPSGATCLPMDCCFSELALDPNKYVGLVKTLMQLYINLINNNIDKGMKQSTLVRHIGTV
jgi:hypothetical protein